jgi:catechol 2,3-dioxygenase-like lactoylglutathione lyase family enzyme
MENKSPPSLAFSHFGIYVHDMAPMQEFYTRMLGFFVTDRGKLETPRGKVDLVFLSRDPDEHHQIVLASGRPKDLEFDAGNADVHTVTHGNALSIYAPDPEMNRIELFIDTPWYVEQPMRVPIDLTLAEDLIMHNAEAHARALPGFKPRAEWRAGIARMMGMD